MSNDNITVNFVTSTEDLVAQQNMQSATSIIDYQSNGYCLIIGMPDQALAAAEKLATLKCTVVCIDETQTALSKQLTETGIAVFTVPALNLSGYLGQFNAMVAEDGKEHNLAVSVYAESGAFDLVLDLSPVPVISAALPPFGYVVGNTDETLSEALETLPDLVGEFEKPKYFEYNASICAHSRSGLTGCTQCQSACATGAISAAGEGVQIDPYLCQGCGSCATVCPSGAMVYAYPKPANAIQRTRELIKPGQTHALLLHTEDAQENIDALGESQQIVPLLVEEVSAFGIDYWASMVSAGVHRIWLLVGDDIIESNLRAIHSQIGVFHEIMSGLGVADPIVRCIDTSALSDLQQLSTPIDALNAVTPSSFTTHNDKRQTLRAAIDALAQDIKPLADIKPLSNTSPFGIIKVDEKKCTLCMACVSVCPAKALLDGQDTPALRMVEANCLQCGLCDQACPESAITLEPQYNFDSIASRKINTLNEEEPFNCIRCQKPFATAKIIQSMFLRLEGHWMFKDDTAKRRLKMCEDCRVKDIFETDAAGIDVHKDEPPGTT